MILGVRSEGRSGYRIYMTGTTAPSFFGSEREFDEGYNLRSFLDLLKFNELGIGDRHAFGLEQ
jgi:hypothetical protein